MNRAFVSLIVVFTVAFKSDAETVTIFDGTFDEADYDVLLDGSFNPVAGFSSTGTQVPVGGNPGSFRQITNTSGNVAGFEGVFAWHFNVAQPYDPADGAIVSLDYSEDSLTVFGPPQEGRLALRQDGILYRSEQSFTIGATNQAFVNNQLEGLVAEDFEGLFNGSFFPTATPDFSENGSLIEFGFLRFSTALQGVNDSSGIDNFTVTLAVEAVPEPSAAVLAASVLGVAGASRRRSRLRCDKLCYGPAAA